MSISQHINSLCSDWLVPLLVSEGIPEDKAEKYQQIFNLQQITKDLVHELTRTDLMTHLGISLGDAIRLEKILNKMKT